VSGLIPAPFMTEGKVAIGVEPNYRTDEQLKAILPVDSRCAVSNQLELMSWLSANLQNIIGSVSDPAQGELLKKLVAGFDVAPIR
jgi:hypothetical protein